jgi:AcrR family transcriptional regulator
MKSKSKKDETRARILAAAIELFRAKGFETATMRDVAAASGIALGAAYYHFDSKDAIVLAFYDQAQQEMEPLLENALEQSKDLEERIRALLDVKLHYFEPNRHLLGALAQHTDPQHPLSPFSERTADIRENDIRFFEQALTGSRVKIPEDLKPHLPRLLWFYQMGLILFWIHDRSPGQRKTHALLDKSLHILVRLIKLSKFPLLQPLRKMVIDLVETVVS